MTPIRIQNGKLRASIVPELGAGLFSLEAQVDGLWVPVLRSSNLQALEQRNANDLSSYILAPFSNRIAGGAFSFEGKRYSLEPTAPGWPVTIHGEAFFQPWKLITETPDSVSLRFDFEPSENRYPFRFSTETTYRLEKNSLVQTISLTNKDQQAIPAGIGIHPYFNTFLPGFGQAKIQFSAKKFYPTDENLIPISHAQTIHAELNFETPQYIGDRKFDHVYTDWNGSATLTWPGSKFSVSLEADPIFSHVVFYTAPDGTVAVEPVTHATDGFNLLERGWPDTGVKVLEPGEILQGAIKFRANI